LSNDGQYAKTIIRLKVKQVVLPSWEGILRAKKYALSVTKQVVLPSWEGILRVKKYALSVTKQLVLLLEEAFLWFGTIVFTRVRADSRARICYPKHDAPVHPVHPIVLSTSMSL
jgi:hypothetical protein